MVFNKAYKQFYSRLSYSFGNEDPQVERQALNIQPNDRILCITASGDRPLHLLLDPCAEVVSIDLNPVQNFLFRLKACAMRHLEYEEYLSFLGASSDLHRHEKTAFLLPFLQRNESEFWQQNSHLIDEGVLYQGAIEKFLSKYVAPLMKLLRGKKVKKLFEIDDIEEQKQFLKEVWETTLWKKTICCALNSSLFAPLLGDPGFFSEHLGVEARPGSYIYNRLHGSLERILAKKNPFLSLVFRGRVEREAFPPYLTKEGTAIIGPRLDALTSETGNVIDYLEKCEPNSFDCFSLSDIASYMDHHNFKRLILGVYRAAKPNARFSVRQFMSDQAIPSAMAPFFVRDFEKEKILEKEDCCCVYRLMVGTITK